LGLRVEVGRSSSEGSDAAPSDTYFLATRERTDPGSLATTGARRDRSSLDCRDAAGRRSYRAIATDSPRAGLTTERDASQLTLAAIHRAMQELESQGYKPDGIVLLKHEA